MRRRDVLKSGSAFVVSPLFWSLAAKGQGNPPTRYIDIHCHVFNAKDLPAEGFLKKIFLRQKIESLKSEQPFLAKILTQHPRAVDVAIEIIGSAVRSAAPSPEEEIAFLDEVEKKKKTVPTLAERQSQDLKMLKQIFRILWNVDVLKSKLKGIEYALLAEASLYVKYWLRREVYSLRSAAPGNDENLHPPTEDDSDEIAVRIYNSAGPIGHTLRWLLLFSRYRFELVDMLTSLNGSSDKPVLMTPALVDFEMWVRDVPHRNPVEPQPITIERQVKVMSRISRRESAARVHGFVAYDPLRQYLYDEAPKNKKPSQSPLQVAQDAISNSGFIGVKVYPPMGFVPYGNAGKKLPVEIEQKYKIGADVGTRFDQQLLSLYKWCRDNDVPVMAHANNSNDPYPGGGKMADPEYWEKLLRTTVDGKDFRDLKLNLGHSSHFEEALDMKPDNLKKTWEWKIGRIYSDYPNLVSDISYFQEVVPVPHRENLNDEDEESQSEREANYLNRKDKVLERFTKFRETFSDSAKFLMYGSDWIMLGIEPGISDQSITKKYKYRDLVDQFLEKVGYSEAERKQIMYTNAVRFLGLEAGRKTNARLKDFHKNSEAGLAWLSQFG